MYVNLTWLVGDNDFMWHRVRPVGRPEDGMAELTLDDELRTADGRTWTIAGPGGEVARFDDDARPGVSAGGARTGIDEPEVHSMRRSRRWDEMSPAAKAVTMVLAAVQVSLAVSAWTDLAKRPAEQVRGSKLKWAAIIGINFVGPIAYFRRGRR